MRRLKRRSDHDFDALGVAAASPSGRVRRHQELLVRGGGRPPKRTSPKALREIGGAGVFTFGDSVTTRQRGDVRHRRFGQCFGDEQVLLCVERRNCRTLALLLNPSVTSSAGSSFAGLGSTPRSCWTVLAYSDRVSRRSGVGVIAEVGQAASLPSPPLAPAPPPPAPVPVPAPVPLELVPPVVPAPLDVPAGSEPPAPGLLAPLHPAAMASTRALTRN